MNKRIAVVPNEKAAGVNRVLPQVCDILQQLGAQVLLPPSSASFCGEEADAVIRDGDVVVALSGQRHQLQRLHVRPHDRSSGGERVCG